MESAFCGENHPFFFDPPVDYFPRGDSSCVPGVTETRLRRWPAGAAVPVALACGSDPEVRPEEIRSRQELGELGATVAPLRELLEPRPDDP